MHARRPFGSVFVALESLCLVGAALVATAVFLAGLGVAIQALTPFVVRW